MIAQMAAVLATFGLFKGMCFHILLALGFPFGKLAWGGKYRILPLGFRIASSFLALIYVFVSITVLEKAGISSIVDSPTVVTYGVWSFTAFFGLNAISNFMSRSKWEKLITTPVSLTLCLLCLLVALTAN